MEGDAGYACRPEEEDGVSRTLNSMEWMDGWMGVVESWPKDRLVTMHLPLKKKEVTMHHYRVIYKAIKTIGH